MNNGIAVTPIEEADSIITGFYYSFSKVIIDCDKKAEVTNNMLDNFVLKITSPDAHLKAFQSDKIRSDTIEFWIIKNDKKFGRFKTNITLSSITKNEQIFHASFPIKLPPVNTWPGLRCLLH